MGKGSSIFSLSTARRRLSVAGPASRARSSPWLAPPLASSTSSSSLTGTASTPPHPCLDAPRPRRLCHRLLVPAGAGLPRPSLSRSLASFSRASLPHQLRRLQQSCRQGICGSTFHCRDFSSKAKKKTKSDGTDSGEENLSKKDLALHQAIDQIQSSFGKGAIMWLGRSQGQREVPVVSTGSFSLDLALGIGGFPKGRVIEVFGPEASGKTTLALHVIAEAQKSGGYCAFVDAEHALDPSLAESIGVNTRNLLLSQPDSGEQALSLVDTLIRSGSVDVVVVDSVAALVPKNELDGEMGDAHVALQARLMSQALRKLSHSLSLSQTILLFINQIRCKVSTFGGFGGPTEVTSGGNALKFYASVRLNIRRIGSVKKGEEIIGNQVAVKIVKNKHAPPFKTAHFELEFGKGICRSSELVDLGLKHKLVKKCGGAMYSFNDMPFRGKDALKSYLTENGSVAKELEKNLRTLIETEAPGKPEAEDTFPSESDLPEEIVTTETSSEEELTAGIEA